VGDGPPQLRRYAGLVGEALETIDRGANLILNGDSSSFEPRKAASYSKRISRCLSARRPTFRRRSGDGS